MCQLRELGDNSINAIKLIRDSNPKTTGIPRSGTRIVPVQSAPAADPVRSILYNFEAVLPIGALFLKKIRLANGNWQPPMSPAMSAKSPKSAIAGI